MMGAPVHAGSYNVANYLKNVSRARLPARLHGRVVARHNLVRSELESHLVDVSVEAEWHLIFLLVDRCAGVDTCSNLDAFLHELTNSTYDILPGVTRLFKLGQFGVCWLYAGGSSPDSGKFLVHRRERTEICVSPCLMLIAKLLPLSADLVLAHANAPWM